jgi:prophage regulatory protein
MRTEDTGTTPLGEVFVSYFDLRAHGITYTRVHLARMMRNGTFPASIRLSPNRIAWRLSELEHWKSSRPLAREAIAA